nr:zf-TFIIB domain-containing protein [Bacteriovorax sp. HI3]
MKCPNCTDSVLSMTDRQGIEIDYCPNCRGIWLDRGELDKLIEKSRSSEETPREMAREKVNDVIYKTDYYKPKRKKSLLEELFD